MTTNDSVEDMRRLLAMRLREWSLHEGHPGSHAQPVVTITREPGCGGEAIAERLCAELGLHLYSWEMVELIAKDAHVSTQLVSTLDERTRSELGEWLAEFQGDCKLSLQAYLNSLKHVLFAIASHGNAVIVGRGSNFFLPSNKRIGLSLVAPLESRIANTMNALKLSETSAREHIAALDTEQTRLIKEYFNADVRDATHYHLVINTALIKQEAIVGIVKLAMVAHTQL